MNFKPSEPIGETDQPDSPFLDSPGEETGRAKAEATCYYQGKQYKKGATICWGGKVHECGDNGWINIGKKC